MVSGAAGRMAGYKGDLCCKAAKNRQVIRGIGKSSAVHARIHPPIRLDDAENGIAAREHCISLCVYSSPRSIFVESIC